MRWLRNEVASTRRTALARAVWPALVAAVLIGVVGGTLSALYPGYRAARLDPAVALSNE